MKKEKAVIILSGGLDSTTLLYDVMRKNEVYPITFNYGQKHKREIEMASRTCRKLGLSHKIVSLDALNELAPSALTRKDWKVPEGHYKDENMKQTVVPNRNMVMLALATSYAISLKANKLYYGVHSGDHEIYPDCRPQFYYMMENAIHCCDWHNINLEAPYLYKNKVDIVGIGLKLKVDYKLTQTCYNGLEEACGKCGSCTERLEAFQKNNAKDPIKYKKE